MSCRTTPSCIAPTCAKRNGCANRAQRSVASCSNSELKREYQEWLQEHNRGRPDSDGRPDRDAREIERWAREHDLPYFDDQVHFPDFRIEYELDGRDSHEDVEVVTEHYRGAHAASVARAGFRCYGRGGGTGGAADAASIRAWPRTSYDPARSRRRLCHSVTPERVEASHAVWASPSVRRGFWRTCWSSRACSSSGSTARSPGSRTARRRTTSSPSSSTAGYATPITPGALHRGRLFHVQYKPLYEAIGEPNNRHRKAASLGRFVERLMLLDAVLADRRYGWLGTRPRGFGRCWSGSISMLTVRKKLDEALVFSDETGEPVGRFRTAWVTAVLKAHGIKPEWKACGWTALTPACGEQFRRINLRWHDLRHEYASRLVERGVPLAQVRDLLGHASATTIRSSRVSRPRPRDSRPRRASIRRRKASITDRPSSFRQELGRRATLGCSDRAIGNRI